MTESPADQLKRLREHRDSTFGGEYCVLSDPDSVLCNAAITEAIRRWPLAERNESIVNSALAKESQAVRLGSDAIRRARELEAELDQCRRERDEALGTLALIRRYSH